MNGKWSPTQLTSILQDHIAKVVTHYNTSAYAWDVVNEALDNNGLKPSQPWYPAVPNYIDVAFQAARKAGGPDVKLFYNDYSVEGMSPKSDQMYKLVKSMQVNNIHTCIYIYSNQSTNTKRKGKKKDREDEALLRFARTDMCLWNMLIMILTYIALLPLNNANAVVYTPLAHITHPLHTCKGPQHPNRWRRPSIPLGGARARFA